MKILTLNLIRLIPLLTSVASSCIAMVDEDKGGKDEPGIPHSYQEKKSHDKEPEVNRPSPVSPLPQEEALSRPLPFFPSRSFLPQSAHYYAVSPEEHIFNDPSTIVLIFENDCCMRVNQAYRDLTGWSEEDISPFLGIPFTAPFTHPEDIPRVLNIIEELAQKNKSVWDFENRVECKNGSYRWVQWLSLTQAPPSSETSKGLTFFCIGRDITKQKEEEEARINALAESKNKITSLDKALHEQNKILQAISEIQSTYIQRKTHSSSEQEFEKDDIRFYYQTFELALQHFIDLSESEFGIIGLLFYTPEQKPFVRQVFGISKSLIKNEKQQKVLDKYRGKGRKLCNFNNILGEIIATKNPLIINDIANYPKPTGIPEEHIFPINSLLGRPLIFNGEVVGIVALANRKKEYSNDLLQWLKPFARVVASLMNDFKMEKWREEAEAQTIARKQAEASSAAKSAFLAHMSHEIRTPLTGILGNLDLINSESLQEGDRNCLHDARTSGWGLLTLVNDVLDASKIEANQIALEKIELSPVKILQEVTQLLSLEAKKQGIVLKTIINSIIPSRLIGDPTRLKQIYFNLIGNAVKFTRKGSISVTLDGEECPEKKNIFLLKGTITDTGIGMAPETQQRLFKPFSQADQSMMRQFGGTGLGLYITKKLCDLMNGDIKVQSQLGVGSTFQFTVEMAIPEEKKPVLPVRVENIDKLPKLHILIVEDNRVSQVFLKTLLNREGCSTDVAENGSKAVEAVQKEHYDLVLMDGEMPVMDGLEATRIIRQTINSQSLPIIGVTAHALDVHREKFLSSGMNGYLTKPLKKEELKAEILRCLPYKER